jgi:hypothetical protein
VHAVGEITMTVEIQRKVVRIVQHLCEKLSDGKVEWKYEAGTYYFTIDDGGTRFSIQFTEQFLLRKSEEDLEEEIHRFVERMLCETSQRPIRRAS